MRHLTFLLILFICSPCAFAEDGEYGNDERSHWSLQPRSQPTLPHITFPTKSANAIDAFVQAKLREQDLEPAARADRLTLVRRVYFDLTGLPPTPDEIYSFLSDDAPDAYERLVDQLLASPRYGEHWGQHWLDVVRFAETEGFEYDRYRPGAWRFRDYVISSFNADKPFDQFAREQLAGDELANSNSPQELLVAVGFHRLGPVRRNAGNAEVAFSRNEVLTEMTDIIGSAFLGLTVGCARCHDHKFDAIRQRDYYALQAFLAATHENNMTLGTEHQQKQWQKKTDEIKATIADIKELLPEADLAMEDKLRAQIKDLESQLPPALPTVSSVKNDWSADPKIHVLDRGDETKKGDTVEPQTLGVLSRSMSTSKKLDRHKPKVALANWITQPDHPLTSRVVVNRIWQYHFGRAIVTTPNDFGVNGAKPTHPRLLDWLANDLVARGWNLKNTHRLILMSQTYRQSSATNAKTKAIDPQNQWLSHFSRRRLSASEIRDAMLATSGSLIRRVGGPSIMVPVDQKLIDLLYKPTQWSISDKPGDFHRRSVYLIAKRNLQLPFMEVFDEPDRQSSCACRESSTHAPQSLEMLNGRMANQMATEFAKWLTKTAGLKGDALIKQAFVRTTGYLPSDRQLVAAREFLRDGRLEEFTLAMFNMNRFLYVE